MKRLLVAARSSFYFTVATCLSIAFGPCAPLIAKDECALAHTSERVSDLKSDERVVFFPVDAWRVPRESENATGDERNDKPTAWRAAVRAWVYEGDEQLRASPRWMLVLGAMLGGVSGSERDMLNRRLAPFTVDDERNKRLFIQIDDQTFELNPTQANGHSVTEIDIPEKLASRLQRDGRLEFRCVLRSDDTRRFSGTVHLIERRGLSVISDIDDTIKRSDVRDKSKLLRNTFLLPFEAVDGMAPLYRKWHAAGARFHFVSAGPWQLYEPLAEFTRTSDFPPAVFHMREFRLTDRSLLEFVGDPRNAKVDVISRLLQRWPERRFVLVGDSGEKDPEVYGEIARKFPAQVAKILIRDVTDERRDATRYVNAFRDVPDDAWDVFTDPSGLSVNPRP